MVTIFDRITSPENLLIAWQEFIKGKSRKLDVQEFNLHLMENIFLLRNELVSRSYKHGAYQRFNICDPKQRRIHKAEVKDRVLHHAIFGIIHPIFEKMFIPSSFSCRIGYGTHKGVAALERMTKKVSQNGTKQCFALKCDIRKFFDSVDHDRLLEIIKKRIKDKDVLWLLQGIIESYVVTPERERERERERETMRAAQKGHTHWQSYFPAFRQCLYE